eukprot:Platyproteum_vivax@DN3615_c0_g1_i1.p1
MSKDEEFVRTPPSTWSEAASLEEEAEQKFDREQRLRERRLGLPLVDRNVADYEATLFVNPYWHTVGRPPDPFPPAKTNEEFFWNLQQILENPYAHIAEQMKLELARIGFKQDDRKMHGFRESIPHYCDRVVKHRSKMLALITPKYRKKLSKLDVLCEVATSDNSSPVALKDVGIFIDAIEKLSEEKVSSLSTRDEKKKDEKKEAQETSRADRRKRRVTESASVSSYPLKEQKTVHSSSNPRPKGRSETKILAKAKGRPKSKKELEKEQLAEELRQTEEEEKEKQRILVEINEREMEEARQRLLGGVQLRPPPRVEDVTPRGGNVTVGDVGTPQTVVKVVAKKSCQPYRPVVENKTPAPNAVLRQASQTIPTKQSSNMPTVPSNAQISRPIRPSISAVVEKIEATTKTPIKASKPPILIVLDSGSDGSPPGVTTSKSAVAKVIAVKSRPLVRPPPTTRPTPNRAPPPVSSSPPMPTMSARTPPPTQPTPNMLTRAPTATNPTRPTPSMA